MELWLNYFRRSLENSRLAQAYLLQSPSHEGMETFALAISKLLLCEKGVAGPCGKCLACLRINSQNHSEFDLLDAKADPENTAKVEGLRERLAAIFSLKPSEGQRRVILLLHADEISPEAQDALLKILEEPPLGSVWILTAESLSALHATILSRCRILRFTAPSWEIFQDGEELAETLDTFWTNRNPFELSKELFGEKKKDLPKRREQAKKFLQLQLALLRVLRRYQEFENFSVLELPQWVGDLCEKLAKKNTLNASQIDHFSELFLEALRDIDSQINPELILDHLALHKENPSISLQGVQSGLRDRSVR